MRLLIPETVAHHLAESEPPADPWSIGQWQAWLRRGYGENERRWSHVCGVWSKAQRACQNIDGVDGVNSSVIEMACLLHDVGRVFDPDDTYPHAVIGALFLEDLGIDPIPTLVAHHSGARYEAELRGYPGAMATWPLDNRGALALVGYIDMTVGPAGKEMTLDERLTDIVDRYGDDSYQAEAFRRARGEFEAGRMIFEGLAQ